MLDMLSPPHPGLSEHRRALAAHRMILTAVQALGSPRGDAAAALLGLVPGRSGTAATRTARRDEAAAHYGGISADWFQRRHEAGVTLALAMELDQQLRGQEGTTRTDPQRRSRAMTPPPPAASFQPRPTPTKTPTGQP
ncbi:hypothetical protein KBI5_10255 [Frankia sp. KB5]|nr:hypothetical protein Manayef4_12120 [Frankia sp. CgIM4]OHV52498.1 hypothetical protein CgIS1_17035 [Frankia sp. CgIS1]ORT52206.1 hypothetical protein KBI5_10255 [Frankia sp. KB5]